MTPLLRRPGAGEEGALGGLGLHGRGPPGELRGRGEEAGAGGDAWAHLEDVHHLQGVQRPQGGGVVEHVECGVVLEALEHVPRSVEGEAVRGMEVGSGEREREDEYHKSGNFQGINTIRFHKNTA